jgi:hypothetical protein
MDTIVILGNDETNCKWLLDNTWEKIDDIPDFTCKDYGLQYIHYLNKDLQVKIVHIPEYDNDNYFQSNAIINSSIDDFINNVIIIGNNEAEIILWWTKFLQEICRYGVSVYTFIPISNETYSRLIYNAFTYRLLDHSLNNFQIFKAIIE